MSDNNKNSPTEAIVAAMEHADEMENVLILWSKATGGVGIAHDGSLTVSQALWVMETAKSALMKAQD